MSSNSTSDWKNRGEDTKNIVLNFAQIMSNRFTNGSFAMCRANDDFPSFFPMQYVMYEDQVKKYGL